MSPRHEPEGWHRLQAMAQSATDAQSLALIIDEMNRILDRHQEMVDTIDYKMGKPEIGLQTQASQSD